MIATPSRRLLATGLVALAAVLPGCAPAGMSPWPLVAAPATPVVPAAAVTPVPAASTAPVGTHLVGVVSADGAPVVGARMRFLDLETGKAIAPSTVLLAETDAQGRFDYWLPTLAARQVVKVVATAGSRTYVTLVDGSGRTLQPDRSGATDPLVVARAPYRLAQAGGTLTVQLRLTSASSAVAKAFEGTVKFQFQLDGNEGGLQRALERAQALVEEVSSLLAGANENALAETIDGSGEISQLDRFRAVLGAAGASDELLAGVTELVGFFKPPADVLGGDAPSQDPITTEDFPLGDITISREGAFSFRGADGETFDGSFADGVFVPNEDLPEPGPDTPDGEEPAGSSGGGSGAPSPDPSPVADGGLVFTDGTLVDPDGPEGLEPIPAAPPAAPTPPRP